MKRIIGIMLGVGLACASQADMVEGQIIGIDFGASSSVDNLTWNQFSVGGGEFVEGIANGATTSLNSLNDTAGSAVSGVTFSLQNNAGFIAYDFGLGASAGGAVGTLGDGALIDDESVYGDCLMANDRASTGRNQVDGANFVLTFTGLDNSLTYNLSIGQGLANDNFNTTIVADGQSILTDSSPGPGYAGFTGLGTDGSGNLVITMTSDGGADHVNVAALTLQAIPEPATLGLVAAFGGAVLFIRRRFML